MPKASPYKASIDLIKAVGIICVVIGHLIAHPKIATVIYLFHMPLFFFLGGYLYTKQPIGGYLKKKLSGLMIPYGVYLLIFCLPGIIKIITHAHIIGIDKALQTTWAFFKLNLYGGVNLQADKGIFWFVTCYFFTQQLYNIISSSALRYRGAIVGLFYLTALYLQYNQPHFVLPLALNVVPYTLLFFWLGQKYNESKKSAWWTWPAIALALSICAIIANAPEVQNISLKTMEYGPAILSVIVALSFIQPIFIIAEQLAKINWIAKAGKYIGGASLTIMFTHLFIFFHLVAPMKLSPALNIIIVLLTTTALHHLIKRVPTLRRLLIGQTHPKTRERA